MTTLGATEWQQRAALRDGEVTGEWVGGGSSMGVTSCWMADLGRMGLSPPSRADICQSLAARVEEARGKELSRDGHEGFGWKSLANGSDSKAHCVGQVARDSNPEAHSVGRVAEEEGGGFTGARW